MWPLAYTYHANLKWTFVTVLTPNTILSLFSILHLITFLILKASQRSHHILKLPPISILIHEKIQVNEKDQVFHVQYHLFKPHSDRRGSTLSSNTFRDLQMDPKTLLEKRRAVEKDLELILIIHQNESEQQESKHLMKQKVWK